MPILLKDILQSDQKKAVEAATTLFKNRRTPGAIANTKFHECDHWQGGEGWIGEKPSVLLEGLQIAGIGMEKIRQKFISENVIAEVNDRHLGGILGREVNWDFVTEDLLKLRKNKTPGDTLPEKVAQAKEADDATTQWWNEGRPKDKLKEALTIALNEGKAALRLFIPRGLLDANGSIPVQSKLSDALDFIFVDVRSADEAGVFIDPDTQRSFGLFTHTNEDNKTTVEVSWVDKGLTFLQVVSDDPTLTVNAVPFDLGGRLWMYELTRKPLITEQVRSNQKSLNLALTMMMRNVNLAGNRQKDFLNAERPKQVVSVPDENGGYREEIRNSNYLTGPGVTNFVDGVFIRDKDGKIIDRKDPSVSVSEPVPIATFVGTRAQFYESILGQTQQIHALISKDATASGVSREQARAEFEGSLKLSKEVVDDAGRWMLEGALRLAAQLMNQSATYANLRCDFNSIIETGSVSPAERQENRADVAKGLMSRETAMSRNGQEDTEAELARIAQEKAVAPDLLIPPKPKPINVPKPGIGGSQLIQ